jgi:hypothetical protein
MPWAHAVGGARGASTARRSAMPVRDEAVWVVSDIGSSGEGEEHFIEGGSAQAKIVERDAAVSDEPHGIGKSGRAVGDGDGDPPGGFIN